jgi:hypothetical protein
VHIAPIDRVNLGPRSTYSYRYWLVTGDAAQLTASLDVLLKAYGNERAELSSAP